VHDRDELVCDIGQLLRGVAQVVEQVLQGLEILVVLVGFFLGDLNLFLEFGEGSGVGALVLLEELEDFLYALGVELQTDRVEVLRFVAPELDFGLGQRVVAVLERAFGVLLQHVLDLLLPVDNGRYKI
jgi:hypothetical protein